MTTRRSLLLSVPALLLLAAAPALAAPGGVAYFRVEPGGKIAPLGAPIPTEAIYLNEQENFESNAAAQEYDEWADDIHGTHAGHITGFGCGFDGLPKGPFQVTLTLYESSAAELNVDSGPGAVLYGPWTFDVDQNTIGIFVSFAPSVGTHGPDLWLGASFSDPTMGMTRHDPPQIGSSLDGYWNVTDNQKGDFGGSPVANFVTRVEVEAPVAIESTTWGRIKSLLPAGN
jgi:hypothetical protein